MKICNRCNELKEISQFGKLSASPDGYSYHCHECQKARMKLVPKEAKRGYALKHNFGITLDQYNQMFASQEGCCSICKRHQSELKKAHAVDHDHDTLEIRGLLCENCNKGIGFLQDSIDILTNAIDYLQNRKTGLVVKRG